MRGASPSVQLIQRALAAHKRGKVQVNLLLSGRGRGGPLLRRLLHVPAWVGGQRAGVARRRARSACMLQAAAAHTVAAGRAHKPRLAPLRCKCHLAESPRRAWWIESMSGAPSGGRSRNAPRSCGLMPSVAARNSCMNEPPAAAGLRAEGRSGAA